MRRKIIKQGHNTLTITLPSKWAQELNIKAGDEIDLLEKDNGLFITTEKHDKKLETEINIDGLNIPTIWKHFMAVYREGYDEVKVKFNPSQKFTNPYKFLFRPAIKIKTEQETHAPLEIIQEITNRFIGFEVVEHHKDYCVIKDMTEPTSKEFDVSLRRIFLLIQQMGEELVEALDKNSPEILKDTYEIDRKIDKFEDYCIRVLNKTAFKNAKKSHLLFSMLNFLELIGDEYKFISHSILERMKSRDLKSLKELAKIISEHFNKFYELYYNFEKEKVIEISNKNIEIYTNNLPGYYNKKPEHAINNSESEIFYRLISISRYINALTELRIEMEF